MFQDALNSVLPCVECFQKILISINNTDPLSDKCIIDRVLGLSKTTVLTTYRNLNPAQHFVWIAKWLKARVAGDQMVMFLCHDDLLLPDQIESARSKLEQRYPATDIFMGDYVVFGDGHSFPEKFKTEQGTVSAIPAPLRAANAVPKEEWLAAQEKNGHVFTNMSGVIVSVSIVCDVAKFLKLSCGRKGCRTEYMLATHRSVQSIRRFTQPVVAIRQHANQEGANVRPAEYLSDEMRYNLWLWLNSGTIQNLGQRLKGLHGARQQLYLFAEWLKTRTRPPRNLIKLLERIHRYWTAKYH